MNGPTVGVLALQGDVALHLEAVATADAVPLAVRCPAELARCDALIIPGGESTTIGKLAGIFGMLAPIQERIAAGMPVFGTCAGLIMLADRVLDGTSDQQTFGNLNATVRRNAFGRQVDSFECELQILGLAEPFHATFIRAPWVESVGAGVEVLAQTSGHPVALRQGPIMATSFHPEIGGDYRLHRSFVALVS